MGGKFILGRKINFQLVFSLSSMAKRNVVSCFKISIYFKFRDARGNVTKQNIAFEKEKKNVYITTQ